MASSYIDESVRGDPSEDGRDRSMGGFVPNNDLGRDLEDTPVTRLVGAPADADALSCPHDHTECFACAFTSKRIASDPFNGSEVQDAYDDMMKLITENYSNGISNPELVKLVYAFYEREIRPLGDFQQWTMTSISRHILYHTNDEDVIMQEGTNIYYSQIQSLRNKTWIENISDGTFEPNTRNIALLHTLVRGLGDHLTKKKARKIDK